MSTWNLIDDSASNLISKHRTETGALIALTHLLFARLNSDQPLGNLRVVRNG